MDGAISSWISQNTHGNDFFNHLMFFITDFGIGYCFWLILILVLLFYKLLRYKKLSLNVFGFLIFLLLAHLIGEITLKNIVKRTRPFYSIKEFESFMIYYKYKLPTGYSFPSGHTFCAFTVAISVSLYNKKFFVFLLPFAFLVGFSRIFIGAHYFSDVLTGAVLGTLLGFSHYFALKYLNKKRKEYKYLCD